MLTEVRYLKPRAFNGSPTYTLSPNVTTPGPGLVLDVPYRPYFSCASGKPWPETFYFFDGNLHTLVAPLYLHPCGGPYLLSASIEARSPDWVLSQTQPVAFSYFSRAECRSIKHSGSASKTGRGPRQANTQC